jgi:hypothetical protein
MPSTPGDDEIEPEVDPGTLQAYYLLQYERMAQHETGRLQLSNFVVAASVVALGAAAAPTKNGPWLPIIVAAAVVVANVVANAYAVNSRRWVKVHQRRASFALAALSPGIKRIQRKADEKSAELIPALSERLNDKNESKENSSWLRSQTLQSAIHAVLTLAALALPFAATIG